MEVTGEARNKGDKARAAAKVGKQLEGLTGDHNYAAEAAAHELQHALSDNGGGKFGLTIDTENGQVNPYYKATGSRTAEEELKYTSAPTTLSENDQKRIAELRQEIKNNKGFWRRLLGL